MITNCFFQLKLFFILIFDVQKNSFSVSKLQIDSKLENFHRFFLLYFFSKFMKKNSFVSSWRFFFSIRDVESAKKNIFFFVVYKSYFAWLQIQLQHVTSKITLLNYNRKTHVRTFCSLNPVLHKGHLIFFIRNSLQITLVVFLFFFFFSFFFHMFCSDLLP